VCRFRVLADISSMVDTRRAIPSIAVSIFVLEEQEVAVKSFVCYIMGIAIGSRGLGYSSDCFEAGYKRLPW